MSEFFNLIKNESEDSLFSRITSIMKSDDNKLLTFREKLEVVEDEILKEEQMEIPIEHLFFELMYARQMRVPKGSLLTSTYHKMGQFDILLKGSISILTADGIVKLDAPYFGISRSGMKRIAYTHEDILWMDIRCMPVTNVEKAEELLYTNDFNELIKHQNDMSKDDFPHFLKELGVTKERVKELSENTEDRVDLDLKSYGLFIDKSNIEGDGIWPSKTFKAGEVIGPAKINGQRTQLGRYVNHSVYPNAKMVVQDGDVYCIAVKLIEKVEIVTDYRETLFEMSKVKEN
jgi:hypothetical protein